MKKILSFFYNHIMFNLRLQKNLYLLDRSEESGIKSFIKVIKAVIGKKLLHEEKEWINKIEMLRRDLNNSSVKISIKEYGVSFPESNITAEEMYQGKVVNTTIGEACMETSKSYTCAVFLFKLIRELRPNIVIEMGTALGISAAYQAAALELNKRGRLITLEGAESLALIAKENFKKIGLNNVNIVTGRFQDNLLSVLSNNKPIDFIFIDGHHDRDATIGYYKQFEPFLSDNAILVFDDINWSKGMKQAWYVIKKMKNIEVVLDLHEIGVCVYQRIVLTNLCN